VSHSKASFWGELRDMRPQENNLQQIFQRFTSNPNISILKQEWAIYGPLAACGLRDNFMRPLTLAEIPI